MLLKWSVQPLVRAGDVQDATWPLSVVRCVQIIFLSMQYNKDEHSNYNSEKSDGSVVKVAPPVYLALTRHLGRTG